MVRAEKRKRAFLITFCHHGGFRSRGMLDSISHVRCKPRPRESRGLFQRSRFLEQMRGACHNRKLLLTRQLCHSLFVQPYYRKIVPANEQQGRSPDAR
jgi:hypothetical protein